ncbi:MAG: hypothetical protein E6344_13915 [Clostridium sp.]|uniref:hypothetical protein n=1 Tax=Clostridium culturomicium TaxID=1499683 RepID=UPI00058FB375|nr:hypothetical protein [Clostridium culturomicium]MDU4891878.1 hypothetical protein [Clostridium sp.]MDU7084787.1 hypothetical protein [Clostridium sp.]
MSTNKGFNDNHNNINSGISSKALGNYTKNAVENFEENIVSQTNYLEKVDNALKNEKNTDDK